MNVYWIAGILAFAAFVLIVAYLNRDDMMEAGLIWPRRISAEVRGNKRRRRERQRKMRLQRRR